MNLKKSGFTFDESQEKWLHCWWISRTVASRLMNLKKSGFTVDGHDILWQHIRPFYDLDSSKPIRIAPHLTKTHLDLLRFEPLLDRLHGPAASVVFVLLCCGRIQQRSPGNSWGTVRGHGTGDWPATHHFGWESRPQETQPITAPGSCKHERSKACAKTVCSWCVSTWSRLWKRDILASNNGCHVKVMCLGSIWDEVRERFLAWQHVEDHVCTPFSPTEGSYKPWAAGDITFTRRC